MKQSCREIDSSSATWLLKSVLHVAPQLVFVVEDASFMLWSIVFPIIIKDFSSFYFIASVEDDAVPHDIDPNIYLHPLLYGGPGDAGAEKQQAEVDGDLGSPEVKPGEGRLRRRQCSWVETETCLKSHNFYPLTNSKGRASESYVQQLQERVMSQNSTWIVKVTTSSEVRIHLHLKVGSKNTKLP